MFGMARPVLVYSFLMPNMQARQKKNEILLMKRKSSCLKMKSLCLSRELKVEN